MQVAEPLSTHHHLSEQYTGEGMPYCIPMIKIDKSIDCDVSSRRYQFHRFPLLPSVVSARRAGGRQYPVSRRRDDTDSDEWHYEVLT